MELDRNYSQIGFILDGNNGMDYRYPLNDMSFLDGTFTYNSTSPCNKENTNYDSRCSEAYTLLKSGHEVIIFNEDSKTKVLLDGPQGAFVYYLPTDFFNEVFSLLTDYSFFLTDFTGNRVIKINQDSDISGTIWEALFANDAKLIESGKSNMGVSYTNLSESGGNTTSFAVTGYNSEYLGALQQLDISVDSQVNDGVHEIASMAVGITVDKGLVLSNWNDVLDGVINTIIIQMVIFLILLCITIAVVWFLGLSITNRITYPIYLFEEYLRGNIDLQAMSKNYNKEVNQILTYLRMLETLEKMINPNFLKNPKIPIRENNLKEALKLFEDIKNRRGKSIIMNLLGNIRYQDNDYQKAVSYYRNALNEIEELTKEVLQQEEDERGLSDAEKLALTRKAGKESLSWEAEKNFLDETLIERKQQLCMGLQAELKESVVELSEVRTKLKEINNYQYEILQHYALTRTHFLRLLKVMIDIAAVFQELKYYHSGIELLDIVHDELKKLEAEVGPEVDIDITRLGRIGVNIKVDDEHNKRLHFVLKNITFEKDVLAQAMYYRRGLLLLENDKHYEAGIAFTLAIVKVYLGKRPVLRPSHSRTFGQSSAQLDGKVRTFKRRYRFKRYVQKYQLG